MSCDPRIICFQHCSSKAIFVKKVEEKCPLCGSTVFDYTLEPFEIPYPFTRATHNPTAIVVRPSRGDFLDDYTIGDDLHIGIVDSGGCVVEFDKYGLTIDDSVRWNHCLALKVVPRSWESHWDRTLEVTRKDAKWNPRNYDQTTMNCFNFVIEFLNGLKYKNVEFMNKEGMCETFVLPKIRDTLRYLSIHRKLKDRDYFVPD